MTCLLFSCLQICEFSSLHRGSEMAALRLLRQSYVRMVPPLIRRNRTIPNNSFVCQSLSTGAMEFDVSTDEDKGNASERTTYFDLA